jgi:hypothetical protein
LSQPRKLAIARTWHLFACASALLFALLTCRPAASHDNPPLGDVVGAIEGESISVQGPMSVETANGQIKTILRSGGDVQVKSGQAHIDLAEGGNITICGPAHFSVLKSGGALTIALDHGTIHAHVEGQLALTIYTAQIQARTVPIGDAPQDALIGLDRAGVMCIHAAKGAVRIEQQLSGQTLLIPQSGEASLANGQLETLHNTAGQCACELQLSQKSTISIQMSGLASTEELNKKAAEPKPAPTPQAPPQPPPPKEEPVYQVFMPPLHYDASAKVQQDYDPSLIVLVRRARVRPTLIFQGKVEGDPIIAQANSPATNAQKPGAAKKPAEPSAWDRVRTFFHNLWSPSS